MAFGMMMDVRKLTLTLTAVAAVTGLTASGCGGGNQNQSQNQNAQSGGSDLKDLGVKSLKDEQGNVTRLVSLAGRLTDAAFEEMKQFTHLKTVELIE